MNVFILNRNLKIKHILSNQGDIKKISPFFNDLYTQFLSTGAETFEFSCFGHESIEIGNYVAFVFDNECKLFQIIDIDEEHKIVFDTKVYCEIAGLELLGETLRPRQIPSSNFEQYLSNVLMDTGWNVGYIDSEILDVHTLDIKESIEAYKDIQEKIQLYDCEISFRIEMNNNRVTGKFIDAYKRRGNITNFRFEYSKNMDKVIRKNTGRTLATAVMGKGKDELDFKSVEWSKAKGDPCDKPLNQDFVADEEAYERYNNEGNHILGIFNCESESPEELLKLSYRYLQSVKVPQMSYEIEVTLLNIDNYRLGDTIYVIDNDFSTPLHLSARINKLMISFTDESKNKCEFSNYKVIKSKIDNKSRSLTHDEVFNKLTENGKHQILYKDDENKEIKVDGNFEEASISTLYVKNINSPQIPSSILEDTIIYVNKLIGSDDIEFGNGAKFKTLQGAISSIPKNLNGFSVNIKIEPQSAMPFSLDVGENILGRGFYGGTLYIYLQHNDLNGSIRFMDCSARIFIIGGNSIDDIKDGVDSVRPSIKPSMLVENGGFNYSILATGCSFIYVRSVDVWGKEGSNNYCIGSRDGSNIFIRNVKLDGSTNGFHAQVLGRLTTIETYGRVVQIAYRCSYGGWMNVLTGNATSGTTNTSEGDGCQIIQGTITWDGQSTTGTNDNTSESNNTEVINSTSGDSYRVKYSSWRNDNTVRQGDWAGYGLHKGCWFFGNQLSVLKGKNVKLLKITLQRQSSGGNSGDVQFTLKMHNHANKPSGSPVYLTGWSKTVPLSRGKSITITITDEEVLSAIKSGTMKGFGIDISSSNNSYYGILTPNLKVVAAY